MKEIIAIWLFLFTTCKSTNSNHKHYTTQIYEELSRGTTIVNIGKLANEWFNNDNNPENGIRKPYKFKFFNCEKVCAMFRIEPDTGIVSIVRRLDRDNLCHVSKTCCLHRSTVNQCSLDLTIRSDDDYSHIIVLVLDVQDINDNSPYWFQNQLSITFSEGSEVGETKSLEVARDNDSGPNGVRTYKMEPVIDKFNLEFKIDDGLGVGSSNTDYNGQGGLSGRQSLRLVLSKKLDREEKDQYEFTLTAIDGGHPSRNGSVRVVVTVSDENDNSPEFEENRYSVTVNEQLHIHTPVVQVKAIDKDSGMNGKIEYRMSSLTKPEFARLFSVESNNGFIRVRQELDYEVYSSVTLIIEATDMGSLPRAATCTVSITINDMNDNAPEIYFEPPRITRKSNIVENDVPGQMFAVFSVQDKDDKENGQVNCHLEPIDNTEFSLERMKIPLTVMYKIKTIKSFDREVTPKIEARILCRDEGSPPLSTRGSVKVDVEDKNDEIPQFSRNFYQFQLDENVRKESYLFSVNATDKDEGVNALIKYSIFGEDADKFSINPDSGRIYLEASLDREVKPRLFFSVRAQDSGFPRQAATVNVSVQLLDVNDNTPYLQETIHIFVFENHTLGKPIIILNATDKDEGLNAQIIMQIQSDVARTTVRHPPNYIMSQSPTLTALPGSSTSAEPLYRNEYRSESESNFVILPDGKLMLRERSLDRETVSRHELTVVVRDRGTPPLSSTSSLIISVRDVNDCAPQFLFPNRIKNYVKVSAGSVTGTTITQVRTIDLDEGLNGKVRYSFKANHYTNKLFLIHPESGKITLQQTLTETDINNFILIIVARDCGVPPKEETASLYIKIRPSVAQTRESKNVIGNSNQPYDSMDVNDSQKTNGESSGNGNIIFILAFVFIGILFIVFISIATAVLIYKRVNYSGSSNMNSNRHGNRDGNQIKSNIRNWKNKFVRPFSKKSFSPETQEDFHTQDTQPGQSLMQNNNCEDVNGFSRSFFLNPLSLDSISQFYGDNKGIETTSTFHSLRPVPKCTNEYPSTYLSGNFATTGNYFGEPGTSHTALLPTPLLNEYNNTASTIKKNNTYHHQPIYQPSKPNNVTTTFFDPNNISNLNNHLTRFECDTAANVAHFTTNNTHV